MLAEFDIYAYLVSRQDMVFFDDDAEAAADQLNEMLHYVAAYMEEDDTLEQLEEVIRRTLFEWIENDELLEIDSDDMQTYILEQLADVRQQELDDDE
jgi:L-asparaginase/Glu-tRNA(Gln) amidotransferase subunit D